VEWPHEPPAALRHGKAPRDVWGAFFLGCMLPPERLRTVQDVRRMFALRWDWGVNAADGCGTKALCREGTAVLPRPPGTVSTCARRGRRECASRAGGRDVLAGAGRVECRGVPGGFIPVPRRRRATRTRVHG
jgi:hypothetical protein